ncbi:type VI lipase adapter Tla3 domain-containing protein [Paraburkholderia phenoliruptrix]|uniref:type VI lipase adapter Tla3 domain-containing protein n=1 Tax=Paraburkholderia phenoliruptrix TaxID=252970 RepID=UPI002869B675|nr:DUF2875 family protein [Paraburkholderia phenoliruptrix]WMY07999.1 DUF2875 family protein [Paraburkholderia phenoliruptrix]
MNIAARPRSRGYLALLAAWSTGWTGYNMIRYYDAWSKTQIEATGMARNVMWGIVAGAVFLAILFFGAWRLRAGSLAAANGTVAGASIGSAAARASALSSATAAEPRPDRLELRGVGVRVDVWAQTDLWQFLKGQKDAYRSVLSNNPKDYPSDRALVQDKTSGALGSSFKYSAGEGVERWPIPVIIFGPPKGKDADDDIANLITTTRQRASLALHMFLTAQAVYVDNPQAQIDYLFDFFDRNPTVPEVLIYGMDGLAVRSWFTANDVPSGQRVPSQFDAMVGLLVSRSDRVNHYMRPYVNDDPEDAGADDRQYDTVKLANFFWNVNAEPRQGLDVSPPSVAHWQSKLPLLWPSLSNKGPGSFKPDDWFPARWARWQLKEFDDAPLLGYLHRPVAVSLKDADGHPLRGGAQADALRAGWQKVQTQLPGGDKVARLFFDSVASPAVLPLLHTLDADDRLDPTSLAEGFDLGHRFGNLGIMGPMVGLGLSAMASYDAGHGSLTANLTPDGDLHFMLVTPPDAAEKTANTQVRHLPADPFIHLVPGG